ncbi:MAG: hypothetical protein H0T60_00110 [Acidobacteria bacterium]|nr:hypothetical protein [Acidobacteriota bacterium]
MLSFTLTGNFRARSPRRRLTVLSLLLVLISCLFAQSWMTGGVGANGPAPRIGGTARSAHAPAPTRNDPEDARKAKAAEGRLLEAYGKLPLSFEANRGQASGGAVKFLSRGSGYALFLTPGEAVLRLRQDEGGEAGGDAGQSGESRRAGAEAVLRIVPVDANPSPKVRGLDKLAGKSNYFVGERRAWRTNVSTYARVAYESIYPGIDLVFYGNQQQLEYDFIVAPGADPSRVELSFGGAESVRVDERGDLVLRVGNHEVIQRQPVAYQERGGSQTATAQTNGEGRYQFADLTMGGSYTVTPARQGFVFHPQTQSFNNLSADATADFGAVSCVFTITPVNKSFPASGGVGTLTVNAPDALCPWTATSNAPWISITSGTSGNGNGSVTITVAPTGSSRTGTLSVAGRVFAVWQELSPCDTPGFTTGRDVRELRCAADRRRHRRGR